MLLFGKDTFSLPAFSGGTPILCGGAAILPQSLWVLGIAAWSPSLAMKFFFERTHRRARPCSPAPRPRRGLAHGDQRGDDGDALLRLLRAGRGSLAGAILAPITLTSYDVGILLGLKGFAACILGGLGNPFGAVAGGILLGILESLGAGLISSGLQGRLRLRHPARAALPAALGPLREADRAERV